MFMLKFNKHWLLPLTFLLLAACQSGPQMPSPVEPEAEIVPGEIETETGDR